MEVEDKFKLGLGRLAPISRQRNISAIVFAISSGMFMLCGILKKLSWPVYGLTCSQSVQSRSLGIIERWIYSWTFHTIYYLLANQAGRCPFNSLEYSDKFVRGIKVCCSVHLH